MVHPSCKRAQKHTKVMGCWCGYVDRSHFLRAELQKRTFGKVFTHNENAEAKLCEDILPTVELRKRNFAKSFPIERIVLVSQETLYKYSPMCYRRSYHQCILMCQSLSFLVFRFAYFPVLITLFCRSI